MRGSFFRMTDGTIDKSREIYGLPDTVAANPDTVAAN